MTLHLTTHDLSGTLDDFAAELLAAAEIEQPPVDALVLAERLRLTVALDEGLTTRARYLRLAVPNSAALQPSILIQPDSRPERRQWAVAHEIGEHLAHEIFARCGFDPAAESQSAREQVANALAGRLLVPAEWFLSCAALNDWDLFELKRHFSTASHELIARRMLDAPVPAVITLFDQGRMTWRKANSESRAPALCDIEKSAWNVAHFQGRKGVARRGALSVQAWPIHEPHWKREIIRTKIEAGWDDCGGDG